VVARSNFTGDHLGDPNARVMGQLAGQVVAAHLLPTAVQDALSHATAVGLSCPPHAWMVVADVLLVWRLDEGPGAVVRRLQLPSGSPTHPSQLTVHALSRANGNTLSVVAVTASGDVAVWLNAHALGAPQASGDLQLAHMSRLCDVPGCVQLDISFTFLCGR